MIAYLKGHVIQLDSETAVIDVGGVGYETYCSSNSLDRLSVGEPTQLYIHTHVREDAFVLYGFATLNEKALFLSLIKVNGVGPKLGLKILSGTTMEHFLSMIENGDVKGLSSIPKVGKKTAEQLILALKGKLVLGENENIHKPAVGPMREVFSALVHLGFKENDIQKVIEDFPEATTFEEGVRKGLSALSGNV